MLNNLSDKQRKRLARIAVALVLFAIAMVVPFEQLVPQPQAIWVEFVAFLVPYLIAGYDVLLKAVRNIGRGQVFDENFLMAVATIGAFALALLPGTEAHFAEGAAVMLFYQVGEWFQDYAVDRSRRSIAEMMDIAPEVANVRRDGTFEEVDPEDVEIGEEVLVRPGDRIPIDGVVVEGSSQLDTSALTGESVPCVVEPGAEVVSGCVNLVGPLVVRTTKAYEDSTVARILELVEDATDNKARTENFITRFARYYTPIVVFGALAIAILPPLFAAQPWGDWIERGLIFLVVSCPCALVISVPLSFFGGIGGASKQGILVKGSNYLEALSQVDTVVFDKTGTLTNGTFNVVAVHTEEGVDPDMLLSLAAYAETYSAHPIALSVKEAYTGVIDETRIRDVREETGHGVRAVVDEHVVYIGNDKLMAAGEVEFHECGLTGTILHVSLDGRYIGHLVIADVVKEDAAQAIADMRASGVKRMVMLTGDRKEVAAAVAGELGIDEYHAQLLPQNKVRWLERVMADKTDETAALAINRGKRAIKRNVAFVGDGINDAPVLARADVGIAMGAMGSDAAIEAADVVLMNDKPTDIAKAMRIARKTMRIVWQNIIFALGVKFAILGLAVVGVATMWLAVFGDVGVAVIAILNAMRCLRA